MSRKSRMQNLREAKDRRAKRLAIGGAVVLAALLAFELPHYLGGGSSSPTAAGTTSASSTPGATTPGATTTPSATGTPAAAVSPTATTSTKLTSSDVPPARSKSQLSSFTLFAGKDPFVPQVSAQSASTAGSSAAGPAATGSSAPAPTSSSSTPVQQTSVRTLAAGTGVATISVNGTTETVRVGESFPSANPVFTLVSLARGAVNIGIANGSYTSGAQTVRLSSGRALTLVDTADGVRYHLRLLSGS